MTVSTDKLPPDAEAAGVSRGEAARRRILSAALKAFGEKGFKAATTREIAAAAGVNLPALKYYFGGKEGLFLACAREIATGYAARMGPAAGAAAQALLHPLPVADARMHLKAVIGALAERLLTDREAELWTAFALREMADQGPAFDLLYAEVWAPGIELTAQLAARARGESHPSEGARIQALTLISSLTAFTVARSVALRAMGWSDIDPDRLHIILREIDAQVDRIGG